jgi:DNA-binding transcriptional MerR regulator
VTVNLDNQEQGLTIDELATRTGTTTRTLRLYQTKALLPPPRIVGRVGYYSDVHVNRLMMIDRLQRRGFSLAGIAELFKIWQEGKSLDELLGLEAAIVAPWNEEIAEFFGPEEFQARYPELYADKPRLERMLRLHIVEREGEGYRIPSPALFGFGKGLVERGAPLEVALQEFELLQDDARRIAKRFTRLFRKHVLPKVVSGGPNEWLPRLASYAQEMKPAVRGLVLSAFTRAMDEEITGYRLSTGGEPEVQSEVQNEEPQADEPEQNVEEKV